MLDINTLFLILGLNFLCMAAVLSVAWLRNPDIDGLKEWTLGRCALAGTAVIYVFHPQLNLLVAAILGTSSLFTGLYLAWLGGKRFFTPSANGNIKLITIAIAGSVCLASYWTVIDPSYTARASLVSVWIAGFSGATSYLYLKNAQKDYYFSVYILVSGFALACLTAILRLIWLQQNPDFVDLSDDSFTGPFLISTFVTSLLNGMGYLALALEYRQQQFRKLAERDPLTGAYNRRVFFTLAENTLAQRARTPSPLSLLNIDLDHFKIVNDHHGHSAGDSVLKEFVQIAQSQLRDSDVLARFGGEEFIALLPGAEKSDALKVAERIRKALAETTQFGDITLSRQTCSIGIASVSRSETDSTVDQLVERSDQALYQAKQTGRNQSVAYETPTNKAETAVY